jgi:electron transfer flavoprotein beta subunit
MKIAVCVKRVPDTETRIKVGADGASIDEAGVKFILNPFDEFAVEEALQRREKAGAGEVVIVTLGSDAAAETIRTALAMGADRGVLLKAERIPPDGLAIAQALAAELRGGGYDLILFGKVAVDDYNHQVGTMTAELLGLPCVTAAVKLEIADGSVTAEREVEGGLVVVGCALPAVITCDKGLNTPRYPALKGIMAAKKKPIETRAAALGPVRMSVKSLGLPPDRKEGRIVGEGPDAVSELVRLLRQEAKVL